MDAVSTLQSIFYVWKLSHVRVKQPKHHYQKAEKEEAFLWTKVHSSKGCLSKGGWGCMINNEKKTIEFSSTACILAIISQILQNASMYL